MLNEKDGKLTHRAMGISNTVKLGNGTLGVQFYDYDGSLNPEIIKRIKQIFPSDCLIYKTQDGYHFISFSLISRFKAKANAIMLSKELRQDYWSEQKDLVLRISPKWKPMFKWYRKESPKPRFYRCITRPIAHRVDFIYSRSHLEFYREYMGLPEDIYHEYTRVGMVYLEGDFKIYHYSTRL